MEEKKEVPVGQRVVITIGFYIFLILLQLPIVMILCAEPKAPAGVLVTTVLTDALILFCYCVTTVVHIIPFVRGDFNPQPVPMAAE